MSDFNYKNNELFCEEVSLKELADKEGTPLYVYSQATLKTNFSVFNDALQGIDHLICYSVKANSNLAVLNLLFSLGAGADIVSGGELVRCLRAGCDPKKIVFSGVGKTVCEMELAIKTGILAFNVESVAELEVLSTIATQLGSNAPVSLRVNPNVDPKTHPYISTGLKKNKFGIDSASAREAYKKAAALPGISIVGIDCHIGSQLTDTSPFSEALNRITVLVQELEQDGIAIKHVDIGGGLGISYGEKDETAPPSAADYGNAVIEALAPLREKGIVLICEPGRSIAGPAGVMVTKMLYSKKNSVKHFTIVDGAFNDLMRPALYGSFHPIQPITLHNDRSSLLSDIVGPICETGDFLARDRELQETLPGEYLSVGAAGAYGFSMASNYNTRPRAAEILVNRDSYAIIRKRETLEQLLENEIIPQSE